MSEAAITSTGNAKIVAIASFIGAHIGGSGTDSDGHVDFNFRLQRKIGSGSYGTVRGILNADIGGLNSPSFVLHDLSTALSSGTTYTYQLSVQLNSHNGYAHTLRVIHPTINLNLLKK